MKSSAQYQTGDTIAAEATPPGRGGISVIRISGSAVVDIISGLFDRRLPEAGTHKFGRLIRSSSEGKLMDEVVLACYQAPNSYTGEDVFEISTHGSPIVVAEVLDAIYELGARPAAPGEFTFRAFLNGRIDLTQSEAVADLVNAASREAAEQALRQLSGGIGKTAEKINDYVMKLLIQCELELDFVEEDVELISREEKLIIVDNALHETEIMLKGYRESRLFREGIRVAIIGPTNVGKSSLFNALIGEERAIVHKSPGTTRDVLHGRCIIGGVVFELFDTAGIRPTGNPVEDEGIKRAIEAAKRAELKISMSSVDLPGSYEKGEFDDEGTIRIMNKIDISATADFQGYLPLSVREKTGMDELKTRLFEAASSGDKPGESTISRERHYNAVTKAKMSLENAREGIAEKFSDEIIAEELRNALSAIDELTGKNSLDTLLSNIFSEFCIGK